MKKITLLLIFICILTGCKKAEEKPVKEQKEETKVITYKMPEKYESRPLTKEYKIITLDKDVTITSPGTYFLTGTASNITITIDTNDTVELILSNLFITNTNKEIIKVKNTKELLITLDSKNKLITNDISAIISEEIINIGGSGSLDIISNDTGIVSTKDIIIESGKLNITTTKEAIKSDKSIYIFDTNLKIETQEDSIKSKEAILIKNGKFNIKSGEDAIKTNWDLIIDNGEFDIKAVDDAIKSDNELIINDGNIKILECNEGIESTKVKINNGNIKIKSLDDAINAKASTKESEKFEENSEFDKIFIEINGGDIDIDASGDGLDSNGELYLNGGTLNINAKNEESTEGSIYVTSYVYYNGTSITGVGNISRRYKVKNQSVIFVSFIELQKKGTTLYIKDKKGKTIQKIKSKYDYYYCVFSSPKLKENEKYYLYVDKKKIIEIIPRNNMIMIDSDGRLFGR